MSETFFGLLYLDNIVWHSCSCFRRLSLISIMAINNLSEKTETNLDEDLDETIQLTTYPARSMIKVSSKPLMSSKETTKSCSFLPEIRVFQRAILELGSELYIETSTLL